MKKKFKTKNDQLFFKHFVKHPLITFFIEIIFLVISFAFSIQPIFNLDFHKIGIGFIIFWLFALAFKIVIFLSNRLTIHDYNRIKLSQELSSATLKAQQLANAAKTRSILQMTYGCVPEWHPINFRQNILVYDVHEQLRAILIAIRDAVCNFANGIDFDAVTVDLVYCYPDKEHNDILPVSQDKRDEWRIITSGDSSCTNYQLHDFLSSNESFYFYLDQNNFAFFNDKQKVNRYYLPSGKDQEYGKDGSIVGITINVKNDHPEKSLVKAMLTITTHGQKLCGEDSEVNEEDYRVIFKRQVLNGFKSLLESELTQMYIRHVLRNKKMCPCTGIMKKTNTSTQQQSPTVCPLKMPCKNCKFCIKSDDTTN